MDDPVMVPVQSKNHKHKAVYTKDSEQAKYCKQNYWQTAKVVGLLLTGSR